MPKNDKQPEKTTDDLPGDGGAREAEVSTAIDKVGELADTIDLGEDKGRIVAEVTSYFLELYKHKPKPWDQLGQKEQRELLTQLEHNAKELVRHCVEAIMRNGRESIRCLLVGFTDKGDDIKAELKVKGMSKEDTETAVLALHRARNCIVLLTRASADDYHEEPAADESEPEQRGLGFEAGDDEVGDDTLSAEGLVRESDFLRTGDQLDVPQCGLCEVRINLKTGMVEGKQPGDDEFGVDVRQATPAELAAERERTADFADA